MQGSAIRPSAAIARRLSSGYAVCSGYAVAFGVIFAALGCAPSPIGDPCVPETIPPNGYDAREVYIETSSVQCRTRVCMVYQLQGNPELPCSQSDDPTCAPDSAIDTQIFCSCRCSVGPGGAANAPLCNCGDGYVCVDDVVTTGGPGVQGGYCVPCIREGDDRNLPSPPYQACPEA